MSTNRELQAEVGRAQSFVDAAHPESSIVTLDNLKAVMRVQHNKENDLILEYGRQATAYVNTRTSTHWGPPREVEITRPGNNTSFLPVTGYATAVLSVDERFSFLDGGIVDTEMMYVRSTMIVQPWGSWWCEATYRIRYAQGLPLGRIPDDIIAAVKRVATHWYENRVPVQRAAKAVPLDVESTLRARRRHRA